MSTLFTFQDHVCDKERLHIKCPHETTINIQWAQYGRRVPSHKLCSPFGMMQRPTAHGPTPDDAGAYEEDLNCLSTTALQVSWNGNCLLYQKKVFFHIMVREAYCMPHP